MVSDFSILSDLHSHSTASDGLLSPVELLDAAQSAHLDYFAITDHDTMAGVQAVLPYLDRFSGKFIYGVEINVQGLNTRKMELLGYHINPHDIPLQRLFQRMEQSRLIRGKLMVQALQNLGISIVWEDVLRIKSSGVIGRPHVARALVQLGVCHSTQDAFDRFVGLGKPAYIPRYKLHPREIIHLIHQAGGIAIWAHPLISTIHPKEIESIFHELRSYGLDGLELFYDYTRYLESEHINSDSYNHALAELDSLCQDPCVIVTGGSDWHGNPPSPLGKNSLPKWAYERFISLP